jgi:hypothetical protein
MESYRVFVSYSHDDLALAEAIVKILESIGLKPMWDRNFAFGQGFHEQIREFIAYSHVFLPIITPTSSQRGWVHQEIGYAMALNIPVLPIAVGALPGQMIEQLHAVQMGADVDSLKAPLSREVFDRLVSAAAVRSNAMSQCADREEDRAIQIAQNARHIERLGQWAHIRQKQSLSTFSVPDKPVAHPFWKARYGTRKRSAFTCEKLLEERQAIGEHARRAGCTLILDLSRSFDQYLVPVRISRMKVLRDFLATMPDDKCRVAVGSIPPGESLLIVGDWFAAESLSGSQGVGYRQTVFVRHAPNMRRRIEEFDSEMEELLATAGIEPGASRGVAIERIDALVVELEQGGAGK